MSILVGAISPEALRANVQWLHTAPDPDIVAEVQAVLAPIRNRMWVETGSEENIALASGGFWANDKRQGSTKVIDGESTNLG